MYEVKALIRPERLYEVVQALHELPAMPGITVSTVHGFGRRNDQRTPEAIFGETTMTKIESVVKDELVDRVVDVIQRTAGTGRPGDGKIFVVPVERAVQIKSGESGEGVL